MTETGPKTRKHGPPALYSLLCLLPPGSVAGEVAALQQRLYTRLGLVSGLCLPPLIPLHFLPPDAETAPGRELSELLAAGLRLHTRGFGEAGGCLFWDLDSPRAFTAWRKRLLAALFPPGGIPAPGERGLFPLHAGFFLARRHEAGSTGTEPADPATLLDNPPQIGFPAAALALLEIRLLTEPCRWWHGVVWEEKMLLPLKKPTPAPRSDPEAGSRDLRRRVPPSDRTPPA